MPKLPRNPNQARVVRALVKLGGTAQPGRGKGSHRLVEMPGARRPIIVPSFINAPLMHGILRESGITLEQFLEVY